MAKNGAVEWQFDGLVGPTHNYAGLSFGNVASGKNAGQISNPKMAALQGLEKMRLVHGLGGRQAFLPPQQRPVITILEQLGFATGHRKQDITKAIDIASKKAPHILASAYSSSFMWAANAATVSPSADTADGRLHLTPANLISHLHRSVEAEWNFRALKKIFHDESLFAIHNSLPATVQMADEGAANHMRVCNQHGMAGLEIFVYGTADSDIKKPKKFPARQHREASMAIARIHGLAPEKIIMLQQSPDVIDEGVFHNDVIVMNSNYLMIAHERAFVTQKDFITNMEQLQLEGFNYVSIGEGEFSVADAVETYLFNSQLIELPDRRMVLVAPGECQTHPQAQRLIRRLVEEEKVIAEVRYLNVRESMRNGGGPACLRLRIVMTPEESAAMHQGIVYNEAIHDALFQWVNKYYRDRLAPEDLADPDLLGEVCAAYAELETLIGLPGLYNILL
jgi:succinylarginine dihydrolase